MTALPCSFARVALVTLCAVAVSVAASAQSRRLDGGVVTQAAFSFYWETRLEPPIPPLSQTFGTAVIEVGPDVVQRVMLDRAQKMYFGYGVRVEALPDDMFRVTFRPLTMSSELQRVLGGDVASWRMLPSPGFPPPRAIRGGDVLELALLTSSTRGPGQKLTDYVTVRDPESPRVALGNGRPDFTFATGKARDFRLEDVELHLESPTVTVTAAQRSPGSPLKEVNRVVSRQEFEDGEATGAIAWIYVPYRGRYLLSLVPHPKHGFLNAGEVRGTSLRFDADNGAISVVSRTKIAPGDAAFNLYVLFEPGWVPNYPNANRDVIIIGAGDATEFLVN